MIQFLIAIILLYILYYAGNIIYDLFLKKEKTIPTEEEYSLVEVSEKHQKVVMEVGIEDVENVNTPKSFRKKETHYSETLEERQNIEYLRNRFEAEQDDDDFQNEEKPKDLLLETPIEIPLETPIEKAVEIPQKDLTEVKDEPTHSEQPSQEPELKPKPITLMQILQLSETRVQMVENIEGHKVFNII